LFVPVAALLPLSVSSSLLLLLVEAASLLVAVDGLGAMWLARLASFVFPMFGPTKK
jgi:hypothetical protein